MAGRSFALVDDSSASESEGEEPPRASASAASLPSMPAPQPCAPATAAAPPSSSAPLPPSAPSRALTPGSASRPPPPSAVTPSVHACRTVPLSSLPARIRALWPQSWQSFNAVQSTVLERCLQSDDHMCVAAPTGAGKTGIFELCISRLIVTAPKVSECKIVYLAPIKALCNERLRDWERRFAPFGLKVAALTGDSTSAEGFNIIVAANVILTTPEKWDTMTRGMSSRWGPFLLQRLRLLLVDEIHLVAEAGGRGSTLEAVVTRMKHLSTVAERGASAGSAGGCGMRMVGVSATMPNVVDVGLWLGAVPENIVSFGPEFRPVPLTTHVVGLSPTTNEFFFGKACRRPPQPRNQFADLRLSSLRAQTRSWTRTCPMSSSDTHRAVRRSCSARAASPPSCSPPSSRACAS